MARRERGEEEIEKIEEIRKNEWQDERGENEIEKDRRYQRE